VGGAVYLKNHLIAVQATSSSGSWICTTRFGKTVCTSTHQIAPVMQSRIAVRSTELQIVRGIKIILKTRFWIDSIYGYDVQRLDHYAKQVMHIQELV